MKSQVTTQIMHYCQSRLQGNSAIACGEISNSLTNKRHLFHECLTFWWLRKLKDKCWVTLDSIRWISILGDISSFPKNKIQVNIWCSEFMGLLRNLFWYLHIIWYVDICCLRSSTPVAFFFFLHWSHVFTYSTITTKLTRLRISWRQRLSHSYLLLQYYEDR